MNEQLLFHRDAAAAGMMPISRYLKVFFSSQRQYNAVGELPRLPHDMRHILTSGEKSFSLIHDHYLLVSSNTLNPCAAIGRGLVE